MSTFKNILIERSIKNILKNPSDYKFSKGNVSGYSIEEEYGTEPTVYGSYVYYDNQENRDFDYDLLISKLDENGIK